MVLRPLPLRPVTTRARTAALAACAGLWLASCTFDLPDGDARRGGGRDRDGSVDIVQDERAAPPSEVSEVVERVLPSVVNVRVTALDASGLGGGARRGEGSGVILDEDGTIVTNAHVVQQALDVTVVVEGERRLEGEVVGTAPERDLAVVRVDGGDLRPVTVGRSSDARLGDPVVAIGYPLGLGGPTVTAGIVSGKNRDITVADPTGGPNHLVGLLQTDAAINPGNSGGALVDLSGRLIGINSAAAAAGAAENVGFAIAIDDALPVIEEILAEPLERRAWLGVQVTDVGELTALQLGLPPDTRGAAVAFVVPGSPAERAGIQQGQVIVAVGGEEIASASDLTKALTDLDPGDETEVELLAEDGRRSVTVELVQRPASFAGG